MKKILNVHIGEIKIARRGELLKAILGSCVGIAFILRERKVCGLAHCLLATNPNPSFVIGARFVDQALPSLMALLRVKKEDLPQLEVVIVGGGNMTGADGASEEKLVGSVNYRVALEEARRMGLNVVYKEGGGNEGRKIYVDASDCSFRVEKIPRIQGVAG